MKILVFGHRMDESIIYQQCNQHYGYDIDFTREILTLDNIAMTKGYEAIIIIVSCQITEQVAAMLKENGVKYVLTRAAGKDHLDIHAIKRHGLLAAYVPSYSPSAISEHTVMMILAVLRKLKLQMNRIHARNFKIDSMRSKELRDLTVGVIGTGRIGRMTIQNLSGFQPRILAYDIYENEEVSSYVTYTSLEELLKVSDIIVLHCPLIESNFHMINSETIEKMKEGVILINTARGGLVDTRAVLEGLKTGKIGGFGLDVYENESVLRKQEFKDGTIKDEVLEELLGMDQVLFTSHTAFYTDEAVTNMIGYTLDNLNEFMMTGTCKNSI